jgi:hypothetical protein
MYKYINDNKQRLCFFSFCITFLSGIAQVPNGNFEEWQTIDSIENPVHWETNNFYVGYYPVAKASDAIEGDYSMKVSSTARDLLGGATGYGCAHVKFVPTEEYKYLTASVRVDTVDTEGEVSIRVKQWQPGSGFYEKIGTWKVTTVTNGVVQVVLPIEQTGLDTVLIEVWAKNYYDPFIFPIGYTEMIIDNLKLTTTVSTKELKNNHSWRIYPNPATDAINIQFQHPVSKPCTLRLFDIHGRLLQSHDFPALSEISLPLIDVSSGIYFLELTVEGEIKRTEKFVAKR